MSSTDAQLSEREMWALALNVERKYGRDAPHHIEERMAAASLAGNDRAVRLWRQVAACYDKLASRPVEPAKAS